MLMLPAVASSASKLHGEVIATLAFTEHGNLAWIFRAHNRFCRDGGARAAAVEGRVLSKPSSPGTTAVDLALPAFALPTGGLEKARSRVMDAFGEDGSGYEGEVAA